MGIYFRWKLFNTCFYFNSKFSVRKSVYLYKNSGFSHLFRWLTHRLPYLWFGNLGMSVFLCSLFLLVIGFQRSLWQYTSTLAGKLSAGRTKLAWLFTWTWVTTWPLQVPRRPQLEYPQHKGRNCVFYTSFHAQHLTNHPQHLVKMLAWIRGFKSVWNGRWRHRNI